MQLDTPMAGTSPTFASPGRVLRSATKRQRSPSPVEQMHPSKRAMYARGTASRRSSGDGGDWVAKTHSLRLTSSSPYPDDALRKDQEDVQMVTDSPPRPTIRRTSPEIPQLALVIPDLPQTATAGLQMHFHCEPGALDPSSLMLPRINVQPATPRSAASSRATSLAPPSPLSQHAQLSPMSWTPGTPPPPSARRPRVSMGPRADCEKCRMGVKGHWMHFD